MSEKDVVIRVRYDVDDSELQRSLRDASGGQGPSGGGAQGAIGRESGGGSGRGAPGGGGGGGGVVPAGGGGGLLKILGKLAAVLAVLEVATDAFGQELTDAKDAAVQLATSHNEAAKAARDASVSSGLRGRATNVQAIREAAEGVPAGFSLLDTETQLDYLGLSSSLKRIPIEDRKAAEDLRRFQQAAIIQRQSNVAPVHGGSPAR